MMELDIKPAQQKWEARALAVQAASDAAALVTQSLGVPLNLSAYHTHADEMLDAWWALGDDLMLKHAQPAAPGVGVGVEYPGWWLEAVGYPDGPPPVDSPGRAASQDTLDLATCIERCPEPAAEFQRCTRVCLDAAGR